MAVTKIWPVKGTSKTIIEYVNNPEKTLQVLSTEEMSDLEEVLAYADDEIKTEEHLYTTGIKCEPETAVIEFNDIKDRFEKRGGRVCYHAYQSFDIGEGTPEQVHEIGVKLAQELWGDKYQVVVATHLDRRHLHNHFVINSISYKDGRRFHSTKDSYKKMREVSDRLCQEYGLSVIENPQGKRAPMYLYKLEKSGAPTRYNVARAVIDEAISLSTNLPEFEAELKRMGCTYRMLPDRKYWTITPPGWSKPIRVHKLGSEYTESRIRERLETNDKSVRVKRYELRNKTPNNYSMPRRVHKILGRSGIERLYLRYLYELGYLPRYTQNPKRLHYLLKEDLLKCELFGKEAKLLARNGIDTKEDLLSFKKSLEDRMESIMTERAEERKIAKRLIPEEEKERRRERIRDLTTELKSLRSEMKLVIDIEERSDELMQKMSYLEKKDRNREVRINESR